MTPSKESLEEEQRELALLEAERLLEIGKIARADGHHNPAVRNFHQALEIFEQVRDRSGMGSVLGNLGTTYAVMGRFETAVDCYERALTIARELGQRVAESRVLGNLGNVHASLAHHDEAQSCFRQALELAKETGDRRGEGLILGNLGDSMFHQKNLHEAEESLRLAIPICDSNFPPAAGAFRASLALLLAQQEQLEEAKKLLGAAHHQVSEYPEEYGKFLCKKGQVLVLAGESDPARAALEEVRSIADNLGVSAQSELSQAIADLTALLE